MIIIDIDILATKTNMIIFKIDIAYVYNLAHSWAWQFKKKYELSYPGLGNDFSGEHSQMQKMFSHFLFFITYEWAE
jgi:hypothetical protein